MTVADVPTFYALQPRWLASDRLFKVFVSAQRLAFAYIAGQVYDRESASLQLQQLSGLLAPLVRRWIRNRDDREQRYTPDVVFGSRFVELDARNFYVEKGEVGRVEIDWRRSLWAPINAGTVTITRRDTTVRRFILVGEQVPDEVLHAVRAFWPCVVAKGAPRPPKGRSTTSAPPAT
jgi:hypothetical protein